MNNNYFKENESNDWQLLFEFNELLQLKELGKAPELHIYDASGYTNDNKYVSIELKKRNMGYLDEKSLSAVTSDGRHYTASTIYIEEHKMCEILLDHIVNHSTPLYINFMNDGSVYVFNLSKLKQVPKRVNKKIWSKGYERYEYERRYELPVSEAYIYKKNNNNKWIRIK